MIVLKINSLRNLTKKSCFKIRSYYEETSTADFLTTRTWPEPWKIISRSGFKVSNLEKYVESFKESVDGLNMSITAKITYPQWICFNY